MTQTDLIRSVAQSLSKTMSLQAELQAEQIDYVASEMAKENQYNGSVPRYYPVRGFHF